MRNTKKTGPIRYAIYSRCSSDDQAHKDFSTLDVQEGLNRQYAQDKGGTVVTAYRDEGITGTTLKRPSFQRLLSDAKAGCFDTVICTYMSRLGRGETFTVAEYLLKEAGVRVEMVKEQFTNDMSGHVNKKMTQFVDGMYVEQVRQWTRTKMEAMVNAGYFAGGVPMFGYQKEIVASAAGFHSKDKEPPKRLVPHPENADIARHAFSVYLDRGTLAAVREFLNSVTSRRWTVTSARNLLTSETYLGVQQFGDWRNEASHEPLVDRDTWQRVNDGIRSRPARAAPRQDVYNYFLRGLVHCPHCGCTYTPWPAKGGQVAYYGCLYSQKGKTACPVNRINADALHYTLLHQIEYLAKHHTVMHRLIAESGGWQRADDTLHKLRGQVSKKKQFVGVQIKNLSEAIAAGSTSFRSLMTMLEVKEKEQDALDQELRKLDEEIRVNTFDRPEAKDVQAYWREFVELWPELTEAEKLEMIGHVVQRVEIKEKDCIFLQLRPIGRKCSLSLGAKFLTSKKWERGWDLNPRPSGYEPDELPDCSTPRR